MVKYQYVFSVTMVKNTLDTKIIRGSALSGILRKLKIDIPQGWQFSAGVRFEFGRSKTLPTTNVDNTEKYYTGDDTDLDLSPDLVLLEDVIEIFGINNDVSNDHSCIVTMEIEST